MSQGYALRCGRCGTVHAVDTSRVGLPIACTCGETLLVRSIRDLRELPPLGGPAPVAGPPAPDWNVRLGIFFLGGTLLTGAALIYLVTVYLWYGLPMPEITDKAVVTAAKELSLKESLESWYAMRKSDLSERIFPEESAGEQYMAVFRQYRRRLDMWRFGAIGLAVVGGTLIGIGWSLGNDRKPPAGPPTR